MDCQRGLRVRYGFMSVVGDSGIGRWGGGQRSESDGELGVLQVMGERESEREGYYSMFNLV